MDVKDMLGVGKLAEVFGRGVAYILRPWKIPSDLKAIGKGAKALAEATPEGIAVKSIEVGDVKLELAEVLSNQQQREAENLSALLEEAKRAIPERVSDDPVDDQWIRRFFGEAQDVSDEVLRTIWAHVLAGKVAQPGAVSLRTLDVLRNLDTEEALLFSRAADVAFDLFLMEPFGALTGQAILDSQPNAFDVSDHPIDELYRARGLDPSGLRRLSEAGLVRPEYGSSHRFPSATAERFSCTVNHAAGQLLVEGDDPKMLLQFPSLPLTVAGSQLAPLVRSDAGRDVLDAIAEGLSRRKLRVTVLDRSPPPDPPEA